MAKSWSVADIAPQQGKRFFITGANSGIGFRAAVELAKHGGVVVLACRDRERGMAAVNRLRAEAIGPDSAAAEAELVTLDLASLDSVRQVAAAEVGRHQPLNCLINNAGVMAPPQRLETKDGFELQFGTNVLGHFALTCLLMPALDMGRSAIAGDSSRVVTVSSIAHKRGHINFDDLQATKHYNPMGSYAQSKLADLMFAFELERRLRSKMLGPVSIAVHPGVAQTSLFKVGSSQGWHATAEKLMQGTIGILMNSEADGALPTLFAATAEEAKGGAYYGPQGIMETRGGDVGPAKIEADADNQAAQQRLWVACEELTGISL